MLTGWDVGGLVGSNSGAVTQCYSTGVVSGTGRYRGVSGLVGANGGTVTGGPMPIQGRLSIVRPQNRHGSDWESMDETVVIINLMALDAPTPFSIAGRVTPHSEESAYGVENRCRAS